MEPALVGRVITRVNLRRKDLRFPFPPDFKARLEGARVERLERRAKYILAGTDRGDRLELWSIADDSTYLGRGLRIKRT